MARLGFDLFCRVVDNFGDIGVCWRLARQLAAMPQQHTVRLWVDDLSTFARIEPAVAPTLDRQTIRGVDIVAWNDASASLAPQEIVVEAFACDPPAAFMQQARQRDSLCVNLEYLSAEPWVASCHGLPSLQANGLRKVFFFPGFTTDTGGLLREPDLLAIRDAYRADPGQRAALLATVGLPTAQIATLLEGGRQVLLFGYSHAPANALRQVLAQQQQPSVVLVPSGVCPDLSRGAYGQTYVHDMPFVDQDGFDRLLWTSDLNCIRGEDSLVRALWAGKPLLWHIYPQEDGAHMQKLQAWLALSPFEGIAGPLMRCWNDGDPSAVIPLLRKALDDPDWTQWQGAAADWCAQLARQNDLATTLAEYCAQNRRKG